MLMGCLSFAGDPRTTATVVETASGGVRPTGPRGCDATTPDCSMFGMVCHLSSDLRDRVYANRGSPWHGPGVGGRGAGTHSCDTGPAPAACWPPPSIVPNAAAGPAAGTTQTMRANAAAKRINLRISSLPRERPPAFDRRPDRPRREYFNVTGKGPRVSGHQALAFAAAAPSHVGRGVAFGLGRFSPGRPVGEVGGECQRGQGQEGGAEHLVEVVPVEQQCSLR